MPSLLRKTLSSLGVVALAAALSVFSRVAAFSDGADPFPHSVPGAAPQR